MNRAVAEVPTTSNLANPAEWIQIEPMVFQRPCIGQEHSASYNQNVAEGHTELSSAVSFSVNMPMDQLIAQCQKAWYRSRSLHPETALELSTDFSIPQLMTYRIFTQEHEKQAKDWMQETFVVVKDRNYEDVMEMTHNRRLPTQGKRSMMFLVLDTREGLQDIQRNHWFIWNASHAITDAFSIITFLNTYCSEIVHSTIEEGLLQDIDPLSIVQHLPSSPLVAYENKYKPTANDRKESLIQAKEQLSLYKDKISESVALYPELDYSSRKHSTHCLLTRFSLEDSKQLIISLKRENVGITYLGAAATILASQQLFGKGHETGALIGMTRNARRWVATVLQSTGRVTIPLATDVVFLWIPIQIMKHKNNQREQLLAIAREIRTQLGKHLLSPHYISSIPYMSEVFVDGLRAQQMLEETGSCARDGEGTADIISPSSPGFSSSGVLPLRKQFKAGDVTLIRHDFVSTGRQVGTSPWIGMQSLDDTMRFTLQFDTKYYRVAVMEKLLSYVRANVNSMIERGREPSNL